MDNELRFYSALWGGYGIAMLATARNLDAYLRFVPSLAVVYFVGGVGRAISWVQVGAPHPIEPREIIGRSLGLDERSDKSSAKPPSLAKAPSRRDR